LEERVDDWWPANGIRRPVELGRFFLLIWASGNKFAVRHVEKRTAMFFLCRAFKKNAQQRMSLPCVF
jgi:hypothetical protein